MRQLILSVFIVAALLLVFGCTQTAQSNVQAQASAGMQDSDETKSIGVEEEQEATETQDDESEVVAQDNSQKIKTFVLTGQNFKFMLGNQEAPELRIKKGDRVRIEFTSTDGFHDWVVDEFNAATERVNTGSSTFVEFVADKKGTFEYYCSVGSHRALGMRGNLMVE